MTHNRQHEPSRPQSDDSRMKVSMRDGIRGWFDVDGMTISVFGSNWTGREIVRVTDQHGERVVSDKRSFRFSTPHEFSVAGNDYRLEMNIKLGKAELRLFRNGELIDTDVYSENLAEINPETGKLDWRETIKRKVGPILGLFIMGILFGYSAVTLIEWMLQS